MLMLGFVIAQIIIFAVIIILAGFFLLYVGMKLLNETFITRAGLVIIIIGTILLIWKVGEIIFHMFE